MPEITLINADCLNYMKTLADKSIDMILADLPYGTTACKWDTIIPFEPLWKEYKRIIKDNGAIVLTASQPFTSALVMSNIKMFKYEWIWEKTTSGGFITAKKRPMKNHENVLVFYNLQPIYNPIFEEYSEATKARFKNGGKINSSKAIAENRSNDIQKIKIVEGEVHLARGRYPKTVQKIPSDSLGDRKSLHPTQKPVALFEYLIKTYTNEGDLVLDNTMGSGTCGVAAKELGRNFIGIEISKPYFEIAQRRINQATTNLL